MRGLWKLTGRERARTVVNVPVLSKPCLVTKGIPGKAWSTNTCVLLSTLTRLGSAGESVELPRE